MRKKKRKIDQRKGRGKQKKRGGGGLEGNKSEAVPPPPLPKHNDANRIWEIDRFGAKISFVFWIARFQQD
jgi:hypothetical protein